MRSTAMGTFYRRADLRQIVERVIIGYDASLDMLSGDRTLNHNLVHDALTPCDTQGKTLGPIFQGRTDVDW